MIDFSKTEEQELLIESIKELLEREMPAEKERECYRNGEFPWDAWKAMAEAGFTGLGLPEEVGGTDVDLMTVALANFTISRYGGPLAAFYSMGMPTMYDVCEFGTPEQIEKYVKPYIAGGAPLALGISEPSTGSDVAGMQTSYAWDGDTAVINGGVFKAPEGVPALKGAEKTGNPIIYGGTFSSDVSKYVAENAAITEGPDGTFTVNELDETNGVAEVGGRYYASLQNAVDNAGKNETVTLLQDTAEDIVIPEGAELTLNLNGKTLTNHEDHTITNKGTLTITGDGTVDNVTHARAAIQNEPGGNVVLNGGAYTRSKENGQNAEASGGNSYYNIVNHGTMEINSGVSVTQNGQFSSMIENGWYNGSQNTGKENSVLTINGGTFSGGLNTIKNDDYGELVINDGTFTSMSQAAFLNWNVATVNGGTFDAAPPTASF